jgi:hypothetical protein
MCSQWHWLALHQATGSPPVAGTLGSVLWHLSDTATSPQPMKSAMRAMPTALQAASSWVRFEAAGSSPTLSPFFASGFRSWPLRGGAGERERERGSHAGELENTTQICMKYEQNMTRYITI